MMRVGVDVGGTFTDIVLERTGNGTGRRQVHVTKVPTTPHDQSEAVVQGILEVCRIAGAAPGGIEQVVHGTTVATNMLIERSGAKVGMLTTRGFRDILHMARHKRPHNFSLQFDVPWQSRPLVRRRDRLPITERIMPPDGKIAVPLDEDEVAEAAARLAGRGVEAVVICFLFSFLNDTHEQRARQIVKSVMPDAHVSASADIVNAMREYERFSSTAMNGYIGPHTADYLRNLETRMRRHGIAAQIRMLQSNGGISTLERAVERPISLLLSGPAGGVNGGGWTGESCGRRDIITIDIGGTSADISVIRKGRIRFRNPRDTQVAGLPVLVPMTDIDAIGAGGGSIARIDAAGAFRVGPVSAGSDPGPACYDRGGTEPTVTDAQVVLGRLDPEQFLGGDLAIDGRLSERAIRTRLAEKLGIGTAEAALGVIRVVNNNMALAIKANSVAKGIDPREYSLMGFGGAGPLHSVSLAQAIGAAEVIVPTHPGLTAAVGLLVTDLCYEFTHSPIVTLDPTRRDGFDLVNAALAGLRDMAERQIAADKVAPARARYRVFGECRYAGQGFELRTEVPDGPFDRTAAETVIDNFYSVHREVHGHAFRNRAVQLIGLRMIAAVDADTLALPLLDQGGETDPRDAIMYVRPCTFDDGTTFDTPRFDRTKLRADDRVRGPALILQHNSTTVIPPGHAATVLAQGELVIRRA